MDPQRGERTRRQSILDNRKKNANSRVNDDQQISKAPKPTSKIECRIPPFLNHILYCCDPLDPVLFVDIHPAVARTGVLMRHRCIVGGNARAVAMLTAFMRFLEDYTPVAYKTIEKHLELELNKQFNYLTHCRPHNIAMGNALRWLKNELHSSYTLTADDIVKVFNITLSHFIQDRIINASWRIAQLTSDIYIANGEHILTFGNSTAVRLALLNAKKMQNKTFRVTVVDCKPYLEGKDLSRDLTDAGVEVTYTLLHAVMTSISDCDKVLLGAIAVLSSGCVITRIGSSTVAFAGALNNKDTYVLCEMYKFTDRSIDNSFAYNLFDDPSLLLVPSCDFTKEEILSKVNALNLVYDIIKGDMIKGVICEEGFIKNSHIPNICSVDSLV